MKLMIDIDEDIYKDLIQTGENTIHLGALLSLRETVRNGTPLDDVLTEIKGEIKKDASEWVGFDYGDGIATALEIIDKHIGKAERGET